MKPRWKIPVSLAALSLMAASLAFLLWRPSNSEQEALETTRHLLRQQGFKIDLAEFNFSTSDEFRARAAVLTKAPSFTVPQGTEDYAHRSALFQNPPALMTAVGSNASLVVWKQDTLASDSGENLWPVLRAALKDNRAQLDAACQAALSGPIGFDLVASRGSGMLLPHLAALKGLAQRLGTRVVLELHDANQEAARTNLLALTRLVTGWEPEPVEVSHLVRFACATIAFQATWQALQADGWTDGQLEQLQHEWASLDFLRGLPDTAAFSRAAMASLCQLERGQPPSSLALTLKGTLGSPRYAWSALTDYWRRRQYRQHGTYEDEQGLLLHYRERELELRRAVQGSTWSEMRQLPGVTNMIPFRSKHYSMMQSMLNTRQLMLAYYLYAEGQGQRYGLLGHAADAEARRRVLITAIALERYRTRHGSYPDALQRLVPEWLRRTPLDFMDGRPLRYRRTDDGRFVLYSVGLDCTDHGGQISRSRPRWRGYPYENPGELPRGSGIPQGTDLVWPRPASEAEVQTHDENERQAREAAKQAMLARAASAEKEAALQRERTLAKLEGRYATQQRQPRRSKEPTAQGRSLSKVLGNDQVLGINELTLDRLLTLKQITTGHEPELATFELPIRYDRLKNVGTLRLLVNADPEDEDSNGDGGQFQECERAANGNCLLVWNTTYDPPGKHFLQAHLHCTGKSEDSVEIKGPLAPFVSSNLCQFDPVYSQFDSKGGILYAKLPESNGLYTIELKSPAGARVRTFAGMTSNGVIKVHWDLTDEHGKIYTNDSVESVFHVTLPRSGRSQTLTRP
jgi:hypothetical protein